MHTHKPRSYEGSQMTVRFHENASEMSFVMTPESEYFTDVLSKPLEISGLVA